MQPEDASFSQRVFHIVAAIPFGKVTTYGEVARLAGSPRAARQVGGVLRRLPEGSTLPWHRVSTGTDRSRSRGRIFNGNGRHCWRRGLFSARTARSISIATAGAGKTKQPLAEAQRLLI